VDLAPAQALAGVVTLRDGDFVGWRRRRNSAPNKRQPSPTVRWEPAPILQREVFAYLGNAEGGVPKNPFADEPKRTARCERRTRWRMRNTP
jgi:hypothetical protein